MSGQNQDKPEQEISDKENPAQNQLVARLKGVGDSLWVTFDPDVPRDRLETELHAIFQRLNQLAANARVVLDPGGKNGHEALIDHLAQFLKKSFKVASVSPPPEKRSARTERVRLNTAQNAWRHRRSDVLMISGRVRSGQKVDARKHLVLLGDLNPGGQVTAGGDIFVMGSLRGTAAAGHPENDTAIVLALDFRPTQVQIGGVVAAGLPPTIEKVTEYAHVENGAIVVEDYLKANPFGKIPWPEVR